MITQKEAAKMMQDATSAELAKAHTAYAAASAALDAGAPPNFIGDFRQITKRAKSAAKKEVMRLTRRSIAMQAEIHSPFKGH